MHSHKMIQIYPNIYSWRALRARKGGTCSPPLTPLPPMRRAHHAERHFPMLANRTCTRTRKTRARALRFKGGIRKFHKSVYAQTAWGNYAEHTNLCT